MPPPKKHQRALFQPQIHPVETNDRVSRIVTWLHSSGDCSWKSVEDDSGSIYTFGHSYWRHALVTKRWARNGNSKILEETRQNGIEPERAVSALVTSTWTNSYKSQTGCSLFYFAKSKIRNSQLHHWILLLQNHNVNSDFIFSIKELSTLVTNSNSVRLYIFATNNDWEM